MFWIDEKLRNEKTYAITFLSSSIYETWLLILNTLGSVDDDDDDDSCGGGGGVGGVGGGGGSCGSDASGSTLEVESSHIAFEIICMHLAKLFRFLSHTWCLKSLPSFICVNFPHFKHTTSSYRSAPASNRFLFGEIGGSTKSSSRPRFAE